MARIPTQDDLPDVAITADKPALISRDEAAGFQSTSRALGEFAHSAKELGGQIEARQEKENDYYSASAGVDYDTQNKEQLDKMHRDMKPGADNFANEYKATAMQNGRMVLNLARERGLSPQQLQKLDLDMQRSFQGHGARALDIELNERDRFQGQKIGEDVATHTARAVENPDNIDDELAKGITKIDASPLNPRAKDAMRKTFATQTIIQGEVERVRRAGGNAADAYAEAMRRLTSLPKALGGVGEGATGGKSGTGIPVDNLSEAKTSMQLSPEEEALYRTHLANLYGEGGVDNEDGKRSTLKITTAEFDGKTYVIPTVSNGKLLSKEDAVAAAKEGGLDRFPSYASEAEAQARYDKMHAFMEKDTKRYQEQPKQAGPQQTGTGPTGDLSAKYESGGRGVGFISSGRGDPGGQSYGKHQLSSAYSMGAFLRSKEGEPYAKEFGRDRPGSVAFNATYSDIARRDPEAFAEAQRSFYARTHYEPLRTVAEQKGFDTTNKGVQEALFSMSVQHGGAAKIVANAASNLGENATPEEQIRALYDARSGYVARLRTLGPDIKRSVLNRYGNEVQDAVSLSKGDAVKMPGGAPADPNQPIAGRAGTQTAQSGQTATDATAGNPGEGGRPLPPSPEGGKWQFVDKPAYGTDVLPWKERLHAIEEVQRVMRPQVRTHLQNSIADIQMGKMPQLDSQNRNAVQIAKQTLAPVEFGKWLSHWNDAIETHKALSQLPRQTPEQQEEALSQASPKLQKKFYEFKDKLDKLKQRDPALYVSGGKIAGALPVDRVYTNGAGEPVTGATEHMDRGILPGQNVEAFYSRNRKDGGVMVTEDGEAYLKNTVKNPQQTWADLFQARLADQKAVGIQDPKIVTRAQAEKDLGRPGRIYDNEEFRKMLITAEKNAIAKYGEYWGKRVVKEAALYRSDLSETRDEMITSRYGKLPKEAPSLPEQGFGVQAPQQGSGPSVPTQGAAKMGGANGAPTGPAKPTQLQITDQFNKDAAELAKNRGNPEVIAAFEKHYGGPGTAAAALAVYDRDINKKNPRAKSGAYSQ